MTRLLLVALLAVGLDATASAQTSHPSGTFNYNNLAYHGAYPPTGYYPGGVVSSTAYVNPGDTIPTTYITHYRSVPPAPVYVPTGGYFYAETVRYGGYAPPYRGYGRVRWR